MTHIEQQLEASILLVEARQQMERMRSMLEAVNGRLDEVMGDNVRQDNLIQARDLRIESLQQEVALLKAQLRLANAKLEKTRRFEVQTVGNVSFLLKPQAG